MSELILRHLDSIAASMALVNAQIQAVRHAVETEARAKQAPQVKAPELPMRCAGVEDARCALRDEEARKSRGSFGSPKCWRCVGCGFESDTAPVSAG